jgi:hypothetical protein
MPELREIFAHCNQVHGFRVHLVKVMRHSPGFLIGEFELK